MTKGYDIIGDIHGHATELEALLGCLGYHEVNGNFRHPTGRRAIFLGDYIDRGPNIRRVLQIVRAMVDAGTAAAILGNHEVNALRYHVRGADGRPLRIHGSKNRKQHQATLDQIAGPAPEDWREWMAWFAELPLWLELDGLRVVHAAWDKPAMDTLRGIGPLRGDTLERFSRKGTLEYEMISRLINGPEAQITDGASVIVNGEPRKEVRIRWWDGRGARNAREAIYPSDPCTPEAPIVSPQYHPYPADAPPVFFGHYATVPNESIVTSNAACLDWGIGKGGSLVAYRWDGEQSLDFGKIVRHPAAFDTKTKTSG